VLSPELKQKLKAVLPIDCHELRDLPGGGIYAYIAWQQVRNRLDDICDFQIEFNDPVIVDDVCCIRCTIAIEGVKRQGLGVCQVNKKGIRGTFVESAVADAFKNAAEQFGVGAYLDQKMWQDKLKSTSSLVAVYKQKKAGQHVSNGKAEPAGSSTRPEGWKPAF
jgi:hypothetical protein